MMKKIIHLIILMILTTVMTPAPGHADEPGLCLPDHFFTDAEVQAYIHSKDHAKAIAGFYDAGQAAEPGYADLGWQFLTTAEFSPMAGLGISLPTLLGLPGFDKMDGFLGHFGGFLALAQFWVDLENKDPMAQMKLAKSGSFWAVGALPEHLVSRAVKISAIGIGIIDYSLTTMGTTAIAGNTEYWYQVYKRYYDDQYGHHLDDMPKWEKLIFETYKGDIEKALTDGMMTFWKDVWRYSYEQSGHAHAEPLPEAKEQIRKAYLAEILPTLKNYLRVKQAESRRKIRFEIQYAYDSMKQYLDKTLRFQGTVQTDKGVPLAGVSVELPGAPAVTTNARGVYQISVKTCALLSALLKTGADQAVLKATYRPDGSPAGGAEAVKRVALRTFDRYLPNRINIVFPVTDPRLIVTKTQVNNERRWRINIAVKDNRQHALTEGDIILTADSGMFISDSGSTTQIQLPADAANTQWQMQESQTTPGTLTARYSGVIKNDGGVILPCREVFQLPESLEVPTTIHLKALMPVPGLETTAIKMDVKDSYGHPVTSGSIDLTASAGQFLQTGTEKKAVVLTKGSHHILWRQPKEMERRATINAVYQPEAGASTLYQPSQAQIDVPEIFPVETKIELAVQPLDKENNVWSIAASVSTLAGDPVDVGAMRVEASNGGFEGGTTNTLLDLSQTPRPVLKWQGPKQATATVTMTYYGDGLSPGRTNRDFLGSVVNTKIPPEADTQAPDIFFTGVRDGATYTAPVMVRVRVTDNIDEPIAIHAFHSINNRPPAAFSLTKFRDAYTYSGAATYGADGTHVVDVLAFDAAGNSNRKLVSFIIEQPQAPDKKAEEKKDKADNPNDQTDGSGDRPGGDSGDDGGAGVPERPPVFSPYGGIYE